MALTDERIAELRDEACKIAPLHRSAATPFARAIEAEVRKQDEALIKQLMDGLAWLTQACDLANYNGAISTARAAVDAARLRLEGTQ